MVWMHPSHCGRDQVRERIRSSLLHSKKITPDFLFASPMTMRCIARIGGRRRYDFPHTEWKNQLIFDFAEPCSRWISRQFAAVQFAKERRGVADRSLTGMDMGCLADSTASQDWEPFGLVVFARALSASTCNWHCNFRS